jgi:hypothetical protein
LTTITTPYEKMPHPQISTEFKYLISDFHLLSRSFQLMMEEMTTVTGPRAQAAVFQLLLGLIGKE